MKYFITLAVTLMFLIFFTSCNNNSNEKQQVSDSQTPSPSPFADPMPNSNIDNSVIEYGQPSILVNNASSLLTYIRFPQAEGFADERIQNWVQTTYEDAKDTLEDLREKDDSAEGEINIQFDSYRLDDRFVGIIEQGSFTNTGLANSSDIIQTFNLDTKNKVFLKNSDMLDLTSEKSITSMIKEKILKDYPEAESYLEDTSVTTKWLDHLAVGHDGIFVILARGVALPGSYGILRILLPYDELGDILLLYNETVPTPKPTPSSITKPATPPVTPQRNKIDPDKPMVALTFDDGPSEYTTHILSSLKKYKSHATFFVIGNLVQSRKNIIKHVTNSDCEVIGHSWDHRNLTNLSSAEMKSELLDTQNAIESIAGTVPRMYRPPYGAVNEGLKGVSKELGFSLINWSVDTVDWKIQNANAIYNAVMKDVKNHSIILCHDQYVTTAAAMKRVIPALIDQGYQLVTVSELLEYSGKSAKPGKIYYSGN
ncbi:MAG: polysaccharide deacetylase family protein [Lachnoclostridium sp.]|nr:polysaccharide deacetylase family protein [Lachnoclostridium sp.]